MKLVIVESPTKAKTLSRFLGKDYTIDSTYGHIRDLPEKELGVDVDKNFKPKYVINPKRAVKAKEIKDLAKKSNEVILATDPDREGEAIAYHIKIICSGGKSERELKNNFKRVVFHEITKSAIEEAFKHPRELNIDLVDAQQARRVLDRLVGYKLSPLLWKKVRKGLSAGRVQSIAVKLIVDREREREAFKAEEYWEIIVKLKVENEKLKIREFEVKLEKINGEKAKLGNDKEAAVVVTDLKAGGTKYYVSVVERKEVEKNPSPPFTTSTLQQTAARLFHWSGKKTMMHAQNLYEKGLITYHRTDSVNLSVQAVEAARRYIKETFGSPYLPAQLVIYKTKSKLAQEAHEAIRPTEVSKESIAIQADKEIGRDDFKLYELIWRRFVSCQMNPAIFDRTKIEVEAKANAKVYLLQAQGEIEKFDGWLKVSRTPEAENSNKQAEEEKQLPEVREGENLQFIDLQAEQKFTQPPARYSEAGLIKKLEHEGIGRPSTYAPIISTIQERNYVDKEEGRFLPTPLGEAVNDFLVGNFADIINLEFTAKMEDNLDNVAHGEVKWQGVLGDFYKPFEEKFSKVDQKAERVEIPVEKTGEKCPECKEGDLIIRIGKFGKFIACAAFPNCRYSRNYLEKAGLNCPKCNGEVIIRRTKKGKKFFGCANYPKCDFAAWKKTDISGEEVGK